MYKNPNQKNFLFELCHVYLKFPELQIPPPKKKKHKSFPKKNNVKESWKRFKEVTRFTLQPLATKTHVEETYFKVIY